MEYVNVVGIEFKKNGRKYYFDSNKLKLNKKLTVIVETERGLQFGTVITDIIKMDKKKLISPLKKVIRISTKKDYVQHLNNIKDSKKAKNQCEKLVKEEKLDMKIIDADYTFDRTQLYFSFISNGRVDFRNLTKKLASIYKVRIELRQIGPRDKAREIGGIGPCGRNLCCTQFLYSFNNITINMAKKQNLALNPSKINGACGRLLCCLEYEEEVYDKLRKNLPKVGEYIENKDVSGRVVSIDILNQKYKLETEDKVVVELSK